MIHVILSLALAWSLGSPVSAATPLLVQKNSGRTSSATALNVAAVSPVTAGNLMVVSVSAWPNAPTSVTDTSGNTYTRAGALRTSSGGAYTAIYYARLAAGGANTVTYRTGGSNGQMAMVIAEFANIASPSPLDAATGAVGNGNVPSSGNLTPTVAGDLMIIAGTHEGTLVTSAYPGSTMIAIATENSSTNQPLAMAYQVLTTTTPTPARFNLSGSVPWAQAGALFKATASGDVTPPSAPTGLVISGVSSSGFTLSWNASTDNVAVSGYRLDVSTQSNFASFVAGYNNANLENVVTTPVTGLTGSTTYFARLRAYDAALNTSGNSAVASTTTQTPPDVTSPAVAITSPANGATVSGSLTVLGTASDNVGLSQVEVRVDSGVWNLASGLGNWTYTLNTLGLADGAYTIAARATDLSGNTSQATRSVTVDNTAPVITGVTASSITSSQAVIGWQTGELSDSRVEYGLTASYGSSSALQVTPVLNHSVTIAGLAPDTPYHYRVYSKDAAGNVAISADAAFTTAAPAPDTIAPSLSILAPSDGAAVTGVVVVSGTAADETGLLSVEVRVDAAAFTAASGLQNWTYNLDTSGLSSGPHTITARATDTSGNTRNASVGITVDRSAPVISNVAVTGITATGATVTWNTNEASNSQVEYSSASSGTLNVLVGTATVSHSMQLNDLSPATLYTYRVRSRDAAGNLGVSSDDTFTTSNTTLPVEVGSQIAGSFSDATGHSAQGHLVYGENSGVWWLFTLTSTADSPGNRVIKSYRSSGPDLRTATWTPGPGSPTATANSSSQFMGSGRALSVAYLNNAGQDVIHAEIAMAFDGQDGTVGHIRGRLSAGTMTWETWNNHVEGAATWTLPRNTALGVSSGKFIHSGGTILQQEVDANVRKSNNADTGAAWTSGFSAVAVIDNSMIHQSNSLAFAALDNNVMLAVYDNGGGPSCGFNCVPPGSPSEPNLNNLGYKRSNANGTWTGVPVGGQGPGDGSVFGSNAIINQNDWAVVRLSSTSSYAFRKSANGSGLDGASYNVAGNNWSPLAPQPPLFGPGQAFKGGAGLFGATDGVNIWLFVINTDAANSILFTQFNGGGGFWTPWATVPGTNAGTHTRGFIAGNPQPRNHRIALIWTEGSNPYREMVAVFDTGLGGPDTVPPSVAVTSPAANSTVFGVVNVTGTASDGGGLDSVEVQIDAGAFAPAAGLANWTYALDTESLPDGAHSITVRATDQAGNEQSTSIGIVVDNTTPPQDTTPPSVSISTPTAGATVTGTVSVTGVASDNVALSVVELQVDAGAYGAASGLASWSFSLNTSTLSNGSHTIRARATDSSGLTAIASIAVTVSNGVVVNVFNNPGFESGTTQWVFPGQGSIDATTRHSGVNSAKMVRTTAGEAMIQNSPRVTVQPNTSYTAEVWVKTSGVAGGNGVRVLLLWLNSAGATVTTNVLVTGLVGTADWQKISRTALVTPANAVSGRLQLFLSGASGTVWFDDVLLFR